MRSRFPSHLAPARHSRRRFIQAMAGGALGCGVARLLGANTESRWATAPGLQVLRAREIDLQIDSRTVNFTGSPRIATTVNGQIPGPLLYWRQGDTVTIRVANRLAVPTSIHWHGLLVPANMDGVPGLSFGGIPPGETFVYRFPLQQSGTYWYHSHSRFQEQVGLYGPIIVLPREGLDQSEREHVVFLSDWTDANPEHLYRTLKVQSDYYNYGKRTVGDFVTEARRGGVRAALADSRMWGQMRMDPTDLLDVSGHAYTYLMNGAPPQANWTGLFGRGERVRLRIINGSAMSIFDVRIPGLQLSIVAADGQDVEPVTVDEFRIGAAETYDVIVEPKDDRAYTIFAQALDRSGYARGTLAPALGMHAELPALDPRPLIGGVDMGMDMKMDGDMSMDMSKAHGHGATHGGAGGRPNVDSIAQHPTSRLDDPGVGLRGNGRRVLTYSDLHSLQGPTDRRAPERQVTLHLTGHMQRYVWSFDGRKFSESPPLQFRHGERLRLVLINDSMMLHPIHLHGMWSEVESAEGEFLVRKHTVLVQPGQQLAYAVSANAPGRWAFHCHLLYHMEAGMFREVVVGGTAGVASS